MRYLIEHSAIAFILYKNLSNYKTLIRLKSTKHTHKKRKESILILYVPLMTAKFLPPPLPPYISYANNIQISITPYSICVHVCVYKSVKKKLQLFHNNKNTLLSTGNFRFHNTLSPLFVFMYTHTMGRFSLLHTYLPCVQLVGKIHISKLFNK